MEVRFAVADVPGFGAGRLDLFLSRRIKGSTRSGVQKLIVDGRVRVDGRAGEARASTRVAETDAVVVRYPRREDPPPKVERLAVLHEDEALLVVDKPAGVLSHPTDKVARNSVTAILAEQRPGTRLFLAHRLDRETSGVLVLTKDPVSARRLQEQFERRETEKEYLALVRGRPAWTETVVDLPLAKAGGAVKVRQAGTEDGAPAVTAFRVEAAGEDAALVSCRPKTGRLHQLRVHLAHLGHPILGDLLYGGGDELYLKAVAGTITEEDRAAAGALRQMLHAQRLRFQHPGTGAVVDVTAPVSEDFTLLAGRCGLTVSLRLSTKEILSGDSTAAGPFDVWGSQGPRTL
ncbi:MAG: RluA family pseudouridine synthase [Elusimicrobia bacterium]|nr:RluA family pseudouridine synthase [Elusimicrobiota bacterium]